VRRRTYSGRDNSQSADRRFETGVVYASGIGDFVESGGQRSHDEGSETRAPKAAKARFRSVEIKGGAHHGGYCTERATMRFINEE
jgi:hypothetical protein